LFIEEAHQILYATKSSGEALASKHPAHVWFEKITSLMGRKRGFKISMIITQKFMSIFYKVRTSFDYFLLGTNIYPDDKFFMEKDLKIKPQHINRLIKLPKFGWCLLDINKYQKRVPKPAVKFKSYMSPSGQV
jgi:hypothetical protein